ncbi:glycosyltransferase family 2 protein [Vibrio alfacsensis]|uniref:glycosyltransferase family 2 protein n=1 Tax=Vibrio alfacsensis TaxID=1074311 RepID=UPI004067E9FA
MMVRTKIFKEHKIFFNNKIGPNGTDFYPMGSETEFARRAFRLGHKCYFSNSFVVHHWIPKQHLEESWILGRAQRLARGTTAANMDKLNVIHILKYHTGTLIYLFLSLISKVLKHEKGFLWMYKHTYFLNCTLTYFKLK